MIWRALLISCFAFPIQDPPPKELFEEKLLATVPEGLAIKHSITFRKDGKAVAYVADNHGRDLVMCGTVRGREYDEIRGLAFAPDGETLAYFAREGTSWCAVFGDKKGPKFDQVGWGIDFHPQGKTIAYAAAVKQGRQLKWGVVAYDKFGETFDTVDEIVFSASGKGILFRAREGDQSLVVVNGHKGRKYSSVSRPIFVGEAPAYSASFNSRWLLLCGEGKPREYDWIGNLRLMPDGKSVAFPAKEKNQIFPVVGTQKGPDFLCGTQYPQLATLSDDARRVGYVTSRSFQKDPKDDNSWDTVSAVVVDGKKGEEIQFVDWLEFGPEGKTFAYTGTEEKKTYLIHGEKKTEVPGLVRPVVFTPDGTGLAYRVTKDGKMTMVVGDKVSPEYESILTPAFFTSDGKKAAFGVRTGRELWWKLFDLAEKKKAP